MSLTQETTKDISDNIISNLEASLNQTIPLLPKAFTRVLAKTLAAVWVLLYKYGGFIFQQFFITTASAVDTVVNGQVINPLVQLGIENGTGRPGEATSAQLLIDIAVETQTGVLESGAQLLNAANGVTYITVDSVALNAPTVQAVILAVQDQSDGGGVGVIANLEPGAIVSFANALPNVARNAVVDSQVVTAADAEDIEVYRARVLSRSQSPPQGGAYADYRIWGEEVQGIVGIFPYTSACPGQVDVFTEATPESSGNPDGIPTPAQLQEVLDSIEFDQDGLATRRPANALVNTFEITRTGFDTFVVGLAVDDPVTVQQQITEGIEQYFLNIRPFIPGLDFKPRNDRITLTAIGGIVDSIVSSAGGVFATVELFLAGMPTIIYQVGIGEKTKGTVTFT